MTSSSRRIGIIDIGSNSIRLAIYELMANGGYRVISEFKESARLSARIDANGALPLAEIQTTGQILLHFKRIGNAHHVAEFRIAATAAIRNATNSSMIVASLEKETGLHVEVLTGEDEARIGFLGMIRTMDVENGFLIDIGGGSTEVSLFHHRKLVRSVSFPFGAVNTTRKFAANGEFSSEQLKYLRHMIEEAIAKEPWIKQSPGLPLIGLGGGVRTISKISQRRRKYSFPQTHNYTLPSAEMDSLVAWLTTMPGEKRKKVDGLSKDRYDIIIPGMIILQTVFRAAGATHYVISGAGLRDGLFFETFASGGMDAEQVAEHSSNNLLALHSTAPAEHIRQVFTNALLLYDALCEAGLLRFSERDRLCFRLAAKLYRIGASLQYYQYPKHSFHMIAHTRIDGLSHREMLLTALIASYKTKNRTQQAMQLHRDILAEDDLQLICKLGILLQLSVALDISETQAVTVAAAFAEGTALHVRLKTKHDPSAEYREVEGLRKDFKKVWSMQLKIHELSSSTC